MSKSFHFVCDQCEETGIARWNGEHWIPPESWVILCENNDYLEVDMHLCPLCNPHRIDKFKTPTKSEAKDD